MNAAPKGDQLIIELWDQIDASNIEAFKADVRQAMAQHPGLKPVMDAGRMTYISSAGLRMLLSLSRETEGGLSIINVSPEVYDIFQITGFTEILHVTRSMREISVEGCPVIGAGAVGTVYRLNADTIVKVFELPDCLPMIENEQRRAKQALIHGIPTAISYDIVRVGEKYGAVYELINARSFNDLLRADPGRADELIHRYTEVIRQVHGITAEPGEFPDSRDTFLGYMEKIGPALPGDTAERLTALFRAMPEDLHMVHGDFHMNNIMLSGDEPLLIDMDTLCVGNPVFDFAGIYVAYQAFNEDEPENCIRFLGISGELCDAIWNRSLAEYLGNPDEQTLLTAKRKAMVAGSVRYLYLLLELKLGGEPPLRERRIRTGIRHLVELLPDTDTLVL